MTTAVVGSGPAGMLAAILVARTGEPVRLLDEQPMSGGHLSYDRYALPTGDSSAELLKELETALRKSGVAASPDSVVWAAFRTNAGVELSVSRAAAQEAVACDRVIFATGTTDRAVSIPGCTLPGVMTGRAARILGERHGVVPGERFAIVGTGAQAERLARDIARWGARVEAVVGLDSVRRIVGQYSVRAIEAANGVADVDVVAIAAGELPDIQLPAMLGLDRSFDAELGGWCVQPDSVSSEVRVAGGASLGGAWITEVLEDTIDAARTAFELDESDLFRDLGLVESLIATAEERRG